MGTVLRVGWGTISLIQACVMFYIQIGLKKSKHQTSIGFFHPFAADGGGGERVLWAAIHACQKALPARYHYTIYTGDDGLQLADMLVRVEQRFNITLDPSSIRLQLLARRDWLLDRHYPVLTMVGQAIASLIVGCEAMVGETPPPNFMIDTMGYAHAYPVFHYVGNCNVVSYVHYPTISSDMLERVVQRRPTYNNSEHVAQSVTLSKLKRFYYGIYAWLYQKVGCYSQLVMVNSTWTQNHIVERWGKRKEDVHIVYPPVDCNSFEKFSLDANRANHVISVGQFRPEKDHALQLRAWAEFISMSKGKEEEGESPLLILIGGCRGDSDYQLVEGLKMLARELRIDDFVRFALNVPYDDLLRYLRTSKVGLHTMWNEHFGIGVVEMCSSGLVTIGHRSGGPLSDIIVPGVTGFLASTPREYAAFIGRALAGWSSLRQLRADARVSMRRFSEDSFHQRFCKLLLDHLGVNS